MYLLIADDLTGGSDAGIQFAKNGLDVRLALSPEHAAGGETCPPNRHGRPPDMVAVNTNTRAMPKDAAAENVAGVIAAFVKKASFTRPDMVFKKIDSTLRGNLGAETDALMRGLSFSSAFLAPAYPDQGRTVRNGMLLVNGVPVQETGFADDPLTPVRESRVAAVVNAQSARPAGEIPLETVEKGPEAIAAAVSSLLHDGIQIVVFDAENAEHLARIASAGLAMKEKPLFIGAAGLAQALAAALPHTAAAPAEEFPEVERVFYICGSAHPMTRAQVDHVKRAGVPVVSFPGEPARDPARRDALNGLVAKLAVALCAGDAMLASPAANGASIRGTSVEEGVALSGLLGEAALEGIRRAGFAPASLALVMTGGETAYAVLKDMCAALALERELFPGIALCRVLGGEWDGLRVVTKAGGFGGPETLVDVLRAVKRK